MISSLNGSVHSQGVKISHQAWLDMGSVEWSQTSDKDKSAAYQAALVCGWTDSGLKAIMLKEFGPRVDDFTADMTIETLKEYAQAYPIEVVQVYETKKENPRFKVKDCDATFQLRKD